MLKTVDFAFNGQVLHLFLNGAALFDFYDRYGAEQEIPDVVAGESRKSFLATCWLLHKLSEQGELARRQLGHTPEDIPSMGQLAALLGVLDVPKARRAICEAARMGFSMEHPPQREYEDLGLLELQKKRQPAEPHGVSGHGYTGFGPGSAGGAAADAGTDGGSC